jgi:hypothetical protein
MIEEWIDITDIPAAKFIDLIDNIERIEYNGGRRIAVMKE